MLTGINYFSVAVRDLAEGVITYQTRFGLVQQSPLGNTRWGFRNTTLGAGGRTIIEMISPYTDKSALSRFMEERVHPEFNPKGEGPYLIGVQVEDFDGIISRIEKAGGQVTREPESPLTAWPHPINTCMTFFELHAPRDASAANRRFTPPPVEGPTIRSIKTVSVAVRNLEAASENLQKMLGLEPMGDVTTMPFGFQRLSLGYRGKSIITLNQPVEENSPVARLMRQRSNPRNPHGEGIYQFVVTTDDVEGMVARAEQAGARVTRRPNANNQAVAWVHPLDTHMTLMELQGPGE